MNRNLQTAMNTITSMAMSLVCAFATNTSLEAKGSEQKYVFAHYMATLAPKAGGATVEDYKSEILEAQARGIDGFAVNCGGWSLREPRYKERVTKIYEAAKQLNSGFKLFISADFGGLENDEVRDMVESFRWHPNQFYSGGKPVLSTFGGNSGITQWVTREFRGDRGITFVPYYYPASKAECPNKEDAQDLLSANPQADGFFFFGAAGVPADINASTIKISATWKNAGKIFMAPVSPFYRGCGANYRVFEYNGFEGMASQWETAIEADANWVEIVTWNDWGEHTYVAPFGDTKQTVLWNGQWGAQLSHSGYLSASRYYIDWFKKGSPPSIEMDEIFYFYRLHPKTIAGLVEPRPHGKPDLKDKRELPHNVEKLNDRIFCTAFLIASADLTISIGDYEKTFTLGKGVHHVSIPMTLGVPRFRIVRDRKVLIDRYGEFAVTEDAWANYNYFSGSAHSDSR